MPRYLGILVAILLSTPRPVYGQPPAQVDVVIVGAGLSGLATARLLKKAGVKFHILEIAPRVGGRVRTVRYQRPGQPTVSADSGMEEYWESNPAVEVLRELKLPVRVDVALSSLNLEKKFYPLGDETAEMFKKKIFSDSDLKALEAFKTKVAPLIHELQEKQRAHEPVRKDLLKWKDQSFKTYIEDSKLPSKVSEWIRVSIECEIGTHWDRVSALDGIAEFHYFLGTGEKSYRVNGGNDKFTEAFAKSVGLKNISLNKRVNRIATAGDKVTVTYLDTVSNTNGSVVAKHVVSTIPLYRLFEVQFDPPLSENKQKAISSLAWGSYFKAHIFVPQSAKKFWTKGENSFLPLLSDSDLGVVYDGNPDQTTGTKIISLLIYGDTAERYNMMPLGLVTKEIRANFDKTWPGFTKDIQNIEFYRYHPRAIAAWQVGRSRFDELSHDLRNPENRVYLAGDHTESSHSDGAFISAQRVVRQILQN